MKFKDLIFNESEQEIKTLYHATYKKLLNKIMKDGLSPTQKKKSWSFSKDYVYLSTDPYAAESYAEEADNVPEEYLDDIVILSISKDDLDDRFLEIDKNNQTKDTFQYSKVINPSFLKIYKHI